MSDEREREPSNPWVSLLNALCRMPQAPVASYVQADTREAMRALSELLARDTMAVVHGARTPREAWESLGCSKNTLSLGALAWGMLLSHSQRATSTPTSSTPTSSTATSSTPTSSTPCPMVVGDHVVQGAGVLPSDRGTVVGVSEGGGVSVTWDDGRISLHHRPWTGLRTTPTSSTPTSSTATSSTPTSSTPTSSTPTSSTPTSSTPQAPPVPPIAYRPKVKAKELTSPRKGDAKKKR